MPDLTKHAEAILRAADVRNHELMLRPYTREAILAAIAALHTEAFEAGAVAMREAAARLVHARKNGTDDWFDLVDLSMQVDQIDPTTLKGRGA